MLLKEISTPPEEKDVFSQHKVLLEITKEKMEHKDSTEEEKKEEKEEQKVEEEYKFEVVGFPPRRDTPFRGSSLLDQF